MLAALFGLIFPLFIVACILVVATGSLFIVAQQDVAIIERLGKFNRTENAGLHVKIPFVERIAARVDLRTCQEEFKIDAKTRDNVTVTMTIAAQYRVSAAPGPEPSMSGVYRAYYMLQNPVAQMRSYLIDALRSSVPQYTLDEVFDKKDAIASDVNQTVSDLMSAYGYDVVSTLITSIDLPADVEASMNSINSAQREKVAAQSLAEAERIKVVTEARARAEAMEQAGIGIANQRKAIAEGISDSLNVIRESGVSDAEANQLFIFTQWTDMMTAFAQNSKQSTIVLPSDFSQTASMFDQMLAANKATGSEPNGLDVK
jgi:regulator of protease activity HflC (stomatin/prohibitin superfamily)